MKKYLLGGLGCLFTIGLLFRLPLSVEAEDNVLLRSNGNRASVVLEAGELKDEVVSLQISFQVELKAGDSQKNQIAFEFDKGITSAVKQYRYHKDTGTLNVYVAGKEDLCQDGELSLGSIVLSSDYEHGASASVQVVDQSLITVNKAFDKQTSVIGSGSLEGRADLTVGNGGKAPENPPVDEGGDTPPADKGEGENPNPPADKGEGENPNPPADKGEEENPNSPTDDENIKNPPSGSDNSEESANGSRPSKKRGSSGHSSNSSQTAGTSADTALGNLLQGALNRRPKTVQGTLSVATEEEQEGQEATLPEETDQIESQPEDEAPIEEEDTSEDEEGFLADKEEVVEKAVDVGLVAGIVSAVVVLILIVLEYRRQMLRRRRKKSSSKIKK